MEQCEVAAAVHPVASVQSEFSLWTRDRAADVIPWCERNGAAFIPFAPLGRGFLTGTITAASQFEADDFRAGNPRFQRDALVANQHIAETVRLAAGRLDATPAQVALAWVLAASPVIVPIPGTRRPERVAENAAAALLVLPDEERKVLDDLPAPTGSRY